MHNDDHNSRHPFLLVFLDFTGTKWEVFVLHDELYVFNEVRFCLLQ